MSHAQAALEAKEGSERARADFAAGINANPFSASGGWQYATYRDVMKRLLAQRDCRASHDQTKCCWEHDRHLAGRANRFHWGIGSCSFCEAEAATERTKHPEYRP